MITLACLDMAGTTVADDGTVEAAFLETIDATRGVDRDEALAYVRETMGQSKIVVFRHLFGGDEGKAQAANKRFEQAYEAAVRQGQVRPLEGAEAAIDELRAAGCRVCLTTGFAASTQRTILDALGWRGRIDLALCPTEELRGRPFPDMVLAAVLGLRVASVHEVAVAGDTASDLESGWRAGAAIVAGVLTGAHSRAQLEAAPHTHVLPSIAELPALVGQSTGRST